MDSEMMRRGELALSLCCVIASMTGCAQDCGPQRATPADSKVPGSGSAQAQTSSPVVRNLRAPWEMTEPLATTHFYVDRSASMAGYVRQPGSPLSDFAVTLRSVLFQE